MVDDDNEAERLEEFIRELLCEVLGLELSDS